MDNYGLTPQGFKRPRYVDIIASMEARAKILFGNNINLNEKSPQGLLIRLVAWIAAGCWQIAEMVYNSSFVSTADNLADLARIGQYIGISPRPATFAEGQVQFTGDALTVVPQGLQVKTSAGLVYFVTEATEIEAGGTILANVQALQAGALYNIPAATINELVNPTAGIDSVTNLDPIEGAVNDETASEFRARYRVSVARPGASTLNAIRAALLDLPGVRTAKVIENDTDTTDLDGRPPHSIACYLLGGDNVEIANAILGSKAGGIQPFGDVCETVTDDSGTEKSICFSFADSIDIHANIEVTTTAAYPVDGADRIKAAVAEYIGGQDVEGNTYPGLSMAEDVIFNRIISSIICSVPGISDLTLEIGTDGITYGTSNIAIGDFEVAETSPDKIEVI